MTSANGKKKLFKHNEVAFLGASCDFIEQTFQKIDVLLDELRMLFIDGSHSNDVAETHSSIVLDDNGRVIFSTDSALHGALHGTLQNVYDGVVVNGQHFEAAAQIIICDKKKLQSVRNRKSQITNAIALFQPFEETVDEEYFELAQNPDIPVLKNIEALAEFLRNYWVRKSEIRMLILAGGKSTRMGEDKAFISYHNIPQWKYLKQLANDLSIPVSVSCRSDQFSLFNDTEIITDALQSNGPAVGIYSAMKAYPDATWLVVACDMPLVSKSDIEYLLSQRDSTAFASAFFNEEKKWPEPLFTLWEPRARIVLWNALEGEKTCPRKLLTQLQPKLISPLNKEVLLNVNFPEEKREIEKNIERK